MVLGLKEIVNEEGGSLVVGEHMKACSVETPVLSSKWQHSVTLIGSGLRRHDLAHLGHIRLHTVGSPPGPKWNWSEDCAQAWGFGCCALWTRLHACYLTTQGEGRWGRVSWRCRQCPGLCLDTFLLLCQETFSQEDPIHPEHSGE